MAAAPDERQLLPLLIYIIAPGSGHLVFVDFLPRDGHIRADSTLTRWLHHFTSIHLLYQSWLYTCTILSANPLMVLWSLKIGYSFIFENHRPTETES